MIVIGVTAWTLRALRQPHMIKSYDLKNAFGSGKLEDLEGSLVERSHVGVPDNEQDYYKAALSQRRFEAVVIIPTTHGPIGFSLGSGGTMGDSNEPEAFMANFYHAVQPWILTNHKKFSRELVFTAEPIGARGDGGWGAFVDDLIRILPFLTLQSAKQLHEDDNVDLNDALADAAYAQNTENKK